MSAVERVRREPPRFRRVTVQRVEARSARLQRVTLVGPELEGLVVEQPAASVRLLVPSPGSDELVIPEWTGNEFLLPDGSRPAIRTMTPRRVDPGRLELDVEVVLHDGGAASAWAATTGPGAPAAVSGPGRGYDVDPEAAAFLLAGDETAIPAISQLLEVLPPTTPVQVHGEVSSPDARLDMPPHPGAEVHWHDATGGPPGDALFEAVRQADMADGTHIWAAGEAAAMQRIRRHLFDDRSVPRSHTTVRGYWKHGRAGD